MTSLHSRIRHALLADPSEAIGSRLSGDTITAAVERIVGEVRSNFPVGEIKYPMQIAVECKIAAERLEIQAGVMKDWSERFYAFEAAIRALKSDGGSAAQPDSRDAAADRIEQIAFDKLRAENARMREALEECRQYVRQTTGSWWNNHTARRLMTEHINPALGRDPWSGE